jgi:uncharacterized membrane protein YhdT
MGTLLLVRRLTLALMHLVGWLVGAILRRKRLSQDQGHGIWQKSSHLARTHARQDISDSQGLQPEIDSDSDNVSAALSLSLSFLVGNIVTSVLCRSSLNLNSKIAESSFPISSKAAIHTNTIPTPLFTRSHTLSLTYTHVHLTSLTPPCPTQLTSIF